MRGARAQDVATDNKIIQQDVFSTQRERETYGRPGSAKRVNRPSFFCSLLFQLRAKKIRPRRGE